MTEFRKVPLSTGVTLNVSLAGNPQNPAVILLHGFPESHRTWREVAPRLQDEFFLAMPDQRGFAGSDLPQAVDDYHSDTLIDDIFALADALGIERFALTGHDWGGAIAWGAALRNDPRLTRLAIVNAPHPVVFQKSLIEDEQQRLASQYITTFRTPGFETMVEERGFDWFFDTTFARHVDVSKISDAERKQYITDWSRPGAFSAMLNWYRASKVVVPPPGVTVPLPGFLLRAFPKVKVPTLVIWGMKDAALLPPQLEGLEELVDDLSIERLPDAGHFAPWEAGATVAHLLKPFLAADSDATAPGGMSQTRSRSRSAARLAAVQALYQQEMEGTALPRLLKEFHDHRLGATIEDARYHDAERDFFDDVVTGANARRAEIDGLISARLAEGWSLERLDRPMRAILRAGAYELIARADVPVGSVISEYVDVAHAFFDKRESGFVNGLLDAIAKEARPARA